MRTKTKDAAIQIARRACHSGPSYSGKTTYNVEWGEKTSASTKTSRGSRYSGRRTYYKTNATHEVIICESGVRELVKNESLRRFSENDDLFLIELHKNGTAIWVRTKGKQLVLEKGWVFGNETTCYHSTRSAEHAKKGLKKKTRTIENERVAAIYSHKVDRRARLISRLCGNVFATVKDAKNHGYCEPGIRAFQDAHGISDSASLPQLVRTGNALAIRLALSIARKIGAKPRLKMAA